MSAFEEVGLSPELVRAVAELGWLLPTPVQAEAMPLILGGGDVMVAAETGSGKTGVSPSICTFVHAWVGTALQRVHPCVYIHICVYVCMCMWVCICASVKGAIPNIPWY